MSGTLIEEAYKKPEGSNPTNFVGYSSNNIYPTFPALMQDGREIANTFQPESQQNEVILKRENIKSNWEYRKYLTDHAVQIMKENFVIANNQVM